MSLKINAVSYGNNQTIYIQIHNVDITDSIDKFLSINSGGGVKMTQVQRKH